MKCLKTGCTVLCNGVLYRGDLKVTYASNAFHVVLDGIAKNHQTKEPLTTPYDESYKFDLSASGVITESPSNLLYSALWINEFKHVTHEFIEYISRYDSDYVPLFEDCL